MAELIAKSQAARKAKKAVERLQSLVAADLSRVNSTILSRMQSDVPLIPELAGHLIGAGGKRLRPMLTLASARMCGYGGERHINLAACVEFIHTATLLHDDVVDESDLRRGTPTANIVYGNPPSVLVGDFLFTRAFEVMVEDGSLKVLAILSKAASVIVEGEVLQLVSVNDMTMDEDRYMHVIDGKTATLFAAACHVGAVVAERPVNEEQALESFGRNLGIAFQLIDDVLDYSAQQAVLGKTIGDDFREGKITLPVILAYRRGNDEERAFWQRCMQDKDQKPEDLQRAVALMSRHGALDDTIDRARHYGARARDALSLFPPTPERDALVDIVDFCISRAF